MGKLQEWLDQDWVRIDSSGNIAGECGTSRNKKNPDRCLPRKKAQSLSKSERKSTAAKKKREGKKGKQVVSNTRAATVRFKEGGAVEPVSKRPYRGKSQKGTAVARGCGCVLGDRRKRTKGSVSQS